VAAGWPKALRAANFIKSQRISAVYDLKGGMCLNKDGLPTVK